MSADSPRRNARGVPAIVPPQVVCDRSIIDSVAGFINDVTLAHQPQCDPKDTITWARFESAADISDPRFGEDWELEGNVAPPLLLILGYGQGVQVWAIPANGEAVEVLSWRHGIVSALRVLPTPNYAENGRADEPIDAYSDKRPLMAICDGSTPAGSNPQFCAVNFVSLKTGAQVKTIKFKNPVLDILANRSSIVITFHERIAVFDARNLEDRLSVTTCFPSPGINPNPVALGSRWMAYSENKLLHSKRSGGGCDGDGVSSYTATVLNAAKSFGKGLRELGEQVAAGLTGTTGSGLSSKSSSFDSATGDMRQPGVVTVLDIKHPIKEVSPTSGTPVSINGSDPIVAHFVAHSEAVVAMEFDNSGMMLLTADKRGHDFHLFRIQPHPVGSSLAAVHHLYVLHRGDTSAKVQNITFSLDSRWVAVSTLRGTTHVFPITPYGGPAGVRTHTSLHVVNKLSRFHRSAGLTADGRSSSPISHSDSTNFCQLLMPYHNPTLPPFPRPTVVLPLAQLRQPFALGSPPGSAVPSSYSKGSSTRQRLSSLSDDNGKPLSVCAVFAKSRSWLLDPPNAAREAPHKVQRKAVDSLFVMAGHGALIQYDLDTKLATNVAKEKICDDTPIELEVEAKAQWNLGRKDGSLEIMPPLSLDNWLIKDRNSCMLIDSTRQFDDSDDRCDSWLSQVEIITHAGPHRRLWMGPQFVFKTYNTPSGSNLSHIDVEAVEIGVSPGPSTTCRPERSSPLNMPLNATSRSTVPVLIESGSYSSIEQSPKLMDRFRHEHMNSDFSVAHGDTRLKEDLADAMRESPSVSHKDTGEYPQRCRPSAVGSSRATASSSPSSSPKARSGVSGGVSATNSSASSATALTGGGGAGGVGGGGDDAAGDSSSTTTAITTAAAYNSQYESLESLMQKEQPMKMVSIEKVVNPLGTVTTITGSCDSGLDSDDVIKSFGSQDCVIHENCDESLFRPVVAIFCDETNRLDAERTEEDEEYTKPPEAIGNKLIVPVIEKALDLELTKKESLKNRGRRQHQQHIRSVREVKEESEDEITKFHITELDQKFKSGTKTHSKEDSDKLQFSQLSHSREHDTKLTIRKHSAKKTELIVEEEAETTVSVCLKLKSPKESDDEVAKKSSDNKLKDKSSRILQSNESSGYGEEKTKKSTTKHDSVGNSPKSLKDDEMKAISEEVVVKEHPVIEANAKKLPDMEVKVKRESTTKKASKSRKSEERELSSGVSGTTPKPHTEVQESKSGKPEEEEMKSLLKTTKPSKAKESADEVALKTSLKVIKPLASDDLEDEKPIEFKRMTAATSLAKGGHKIAKIDKAVTVKTKEENKSKANERKVKLEKDSSIESADSVESKAKSAKSSRETTEKTCAPVSKSKEKIVLETSADPVQEDAKDVAVTIASKKRTKMDLKKMPSQKTGVSFFVELSNASDLADSMLDFQQEQVELENKFVEVVEKSEENLPSDVDLKLNKSVLPEHKTEALKAEGDDRKDVYADKEHKKVSKKTKLDKLEKATSSSRSKLEGIESKDCTDSVPKPFSKNDTVTSAKEKKENDDDFKSICEVSAEPQESKTKIKSKKMMEMEKMEGKSYLPAPDLSSEPESKSFDDLKSICEVSAEPQESKTKLKSKKMMEMERKSYLPTSDLQSEPKGTQCIEVSSPKPIEVKGRKDKLTKLLELSKKKSPTKDDSDSDKPPTREKSLETTSNKISIEPIQVDTFLTDLMDSQKATKSKGSPTESTKSEESPKKLLGSPLKFVDTYAESMPSTEIPARKDKSKKKSPPGNIEKVSEKLQETPSASRVKSNDEIKFFDKFIQNTLKSTNEPMTPWKSVVNTDDKPDALDLDYPTLGKAIKSKKSPSPPAEKQKKTISFTAEVEKNFDTSSIIDDLPSLQPLEEMPLGFLSPLPPFEPSDKTDENISLINFESPLQEAAKPIKTDLEKSKTTATPQFPKGFPTDTIIFALCGSLHYENENSGKPVDSPLTLSFSDSTAHSTAEYKSLTENDDQYLSLEQSSQENAPSTSSSTCDDITEAAYSSGGSDKTTILLGKNKNKLRRKKQIITTAPDDDEELRPLINKNDEVNLMTCSLSVNNKCTNADEATAINESLPSLDNNQINTDSSSSDQATTSEDPDDQICLNVHASDGNSDEKMSQSADKSPQGDTNLTASVPSPPQSISQQQQQPNSSKKKLKRRKR